MLIYVCSSNPGKLNEFALVAHEEGLSHLTLAPLPNLNDIPVPKETGSVFSENAIAKALYYSAFTSEIVLADDSGVWVDALNGRPGVLSARYAGPNASDLDNNNLLLRDLAATAHRQARFICALALARQKKLLMVERGVVEGKILLAPRGANGFGYDPLFFYPPFQKSFGEISAEEKFSVSHRGNAIRTLMRRLPEVLAKKI